MQMNERQLLSGDEAVALAALHTGVMLGTGYPGTPSTEILEEFDRLGGKAQWSPNEKVAMEVGLGAAYAGARVLVTMKHVGVNVAADPLFTAAYTGVSGALVLISADDPGMASSQNEQDNRHYARAAGLPMLEPADSQEAYDFLRGAMEISARWSIPVILRMTTRVCHSRTLVTAREADAVAPVQAFVRDIQARVMIPGYARPAHRRLREKLDAIAQWGETAPQTAIMEGLPALGIIATGIAVMHAREAAPEARILKLGQIWPLPMERIAAFVQSVERCVVIEEGDPFIYDELRAHGLAVEGKPSMYRFGELNVARVRRILTGDVSPETAPPRGRPPQLCTACPHRSVFEVLKEMDCIVSGDIGCYTLGVLPPLQAMDTCVCMGASIGVGLGLRHALPEAEARRVVSVIGDSTFVHSGLTGVAEMVYNPPATGHVLLILDNGTTAMTGQQEHAGTGRRLNHEATGKLDFEMLCRAVGIDHVETIDPVMAQDALRQTLKAALASNRTTVLIARRPCILAAGKIKQYEKANQEAQAASCGCNCTCEDKGN